EGKLGGQATVKGVAGTWKDLTDNVNSMASNLTSQVRNIADVTTAVAKGDLSKKITVSVQGEILELKNTINTMVDQLSSFASEVTRVAREVGTEGKLGGQAQVKGVAGTWKDLTDNVNSMAANLTTQVRGIAKVVTAVANGDLKRKLVLEVKGEIAELAETINGMIDTLAVFADQVTTVAREVGIEGKLGGQASVPGAAGLWRHLTDNVNQLAANLTTQVRAIADVATAVTKGDLTRSIAVEAQGEVASLKDNINEMIRNLKETPRENKEQDWLKTNLAKFTRMLQGQRDLLAVSHLILSELAPLVEAQHGVFYITEVKDKDKDNARGLRLLAGYAHKEGKSLPRWINLGESLIGQCAVEKKSFRLTDIPDGFVPISTALGAAPPRNIAILPALFEGEVKAVLELASLRPLTDVHMAFLEQLTESIGIVLNTIAATTRTEELLKQSQALTEELKETNRRLEQQNQEVEQKNREVEQARVSLEEKAAQLALTSKYKSQFLANTSHELRTPLNSLLILSKTLTENQEGNLTPKQVEFAKTIHASGSDLLELINDILDLSKIESGTMVLDIGPIPFHALHDYVERTSRHVALAKGLEFSIDLAPDLPQAITTDSKRLQQVLKNLLSNAFKFTERGQVSMHVAVAREGWSPDNEPLNTAKTVIALAVTDTGIGIPKDKQQIIFEAFQQADGTTNRKYGGTGLGLSISREIARLLGGELGLKSVPGEGSTFTLFLPVSYVASNRRPAVSIPPFAGIAEQVSGDVPMEGIIGATVESSSLSEVEMHDDRASLQSKDRVLLVVDDDPSFARILMDMARVVGFKVLASSRADRALTLTKNYKPHALILDIRLPDADGWTVLDRIKHDMNTRHIPVYVISGGEDRRRGAQLGAMGFLQKPAAKEILEETLKRIHAFIERDVKRLLVVEGDASCRSKIIDLIGNGGIQTTAVSSGTEAIATLKAGSFDCMVLDPALPDVSAAELLRSLSLQSIQLPVILYGPNNPSKEQAADLELAAGGMLVKDATSPERLLDRALLLLHRPCASLQEPQKRLLEAVRQDDPVLAGRKVLVVDDDVRNIFALTTVLERYKIQVVYAESGRQALASLNVTPDVDIVLMDIMMPAMDGYETTRAIRRMEKFGELPIIALTAKAMKGDREKCIEAGASDYIAKPVDMEYLCSLLRVWISR
ncbi:MAG: response regulator, partial [Elusimicrobia bacterium]|nr:response regulator [Elusimicrobiota bacterium]